jgi:hypothetical protein
LRGFLVARFIARFGLDFEALDFGEPLDQALFLLGQTFDGFAVIYEAVDELVEAGQLGNGIRGVGVPIDEVLVAIDDHSELGTPVANVVITDDAVAEEAERTGQRVADDGRADVADVHRLGDVGRGIIDDDRAGIFNGRDAEALVVDGLIELVSEPVIAEAEINEAGAGDFGRLAQIFELRGGNELSGDASRRLAELLAERHGEIGLVVAEFGVLGWADEVEQLGDFGRVGHEGGQGRSKAVFERGEDIHASLRLTQSRRGAETQRRMDDHQAKQWQARMPAPTDRKQVSSRLMGKEQARRLLRLGK